jgi:TolB-like protein/Flp pilus assembly protein TadD/tRNA A-37 threonylcarbamoyl transferase component Bud32
MECPKCHFENPEDSSFCGKCAAPLPSLEEISATPTKTLEKKPDELTRGTTFAARYEVIEELGKGGMGKVYRAFDKKIEEEVALKLIRPEISSEKKTIERFRNELKVARKIAHRNVCKMYDLGEEGGTHYITMEYVPGKSLKSMIGMMGQLSAGQVVFITKQICEGLAEAHRSGVVHRDLKPSNIIIDRDGNTHIMDFGIARSLRAKGLTGPGKIIGTPEYMSPEQVDGKEVDLRSDIYSLGVILYEMMTGKLPFVGDTPLSIALKHKTETPPDPGQYNAQIPEGLSQLILRCMNKDKEKRYKDTKELLSELTKVEEVISTVERVVPARKRTSSSEITVTFRKPWIMIAGIIAVVVVAVIAFLYLRRETPVPPSTETKMLAILPFENLGPVEDEYFADGIAEEITSRLSALHGLGVISRTSAKQYKDSAKTTRQIGEELGVDYILEGTVRWDRSAEGKGRVRVTPQLIRVSDDTHLWSDSYNRALEDIFSVQSEIAEQVAKQLDIVVLVPERNALYAKPTDNLDAYDLFLRGVKHFDLGMANRITSELDQAIELLEKAVELDPDFTFAHISLANIHSAAYHSGIDRTEERKEMARVAVEKVLELEPALPEAQLALGRYYYAIQDYDRTIEIFEAIQKARPNLAPSYVGAIQMRQGKWEQSAEIYIKSFKLNPRSPGTAHSLGIIYERMRKYEEAMDWFDRALSIYADYTWSQFGKVRVYYLANGDTEKARALLETLPPHRFNDYWWILNGLLERNYQGVLDRLNSLSYDVAEGEYFNFYKHLAYAMVYQAMNNQPLMKTHAEEASTALEEALREHPEDSRIHASLGLAYAYLGRKEEAIREGKRAVDLYPQSKDAYGAPHYVNSLAMIYTVVGEYEEAINQLEYLMSIPSGDIISIPVLRLDPMWDPLRQHPRFQSLLEEN